MFQNKISVSLSIDLEELPLGWIHSMGLIDCMSVLVLYESVILAVTAHGYDEIPQIVRICILSLWISELCNLKINYYYYYYYYLLPSLLVQKQGQKQIISRHLMGTLTEHCNADSPVDLGSHAVVCLTDKHPFIIRHHVVDHQRPVDLLDDAVVVDRYQTIVFPPARLRLRVACGNTWQCQFGARPDGVGLGKRRQHLHRDWREWATQTG